MKLAVGTSIFSYIYVRYKWTQLDQCGVEIIPPKISTLGTMNQYFGTNKYFEWAENELLKKNRRTVGFYRGTTPTILTVDDELIRLVFTTHFGSFPSRVPIGQSMGNGPIFGETLEIISDMPRWKRLRSTLSAGFSTKQLNEMIIAISKSIGIEFPSKILSAKFYQKYFRTICRKSWSLER